jgi:hypothetical protein
MQIDPPHFLRSALQALQSGQVRSADTATRRAVLLDPALADAWLIRVDLWLQARDLSRMSTALRRHFTLTGGDPGPLLHKIARQVSRIAPAPTALGCGRKAVLAAPELSSGWIVLATHLGRSQQLGAATRASRFATVLTPAGEEAWWLFFQTAGHTDRTAASRVLRDDFKVRSKSVKFAVLHLETLFKLQDWGAFGDWMTVYRHQFGVVDPDLWILQSRAHLAHGDATQSELAAKSALLITPSSLEATIALASAGAAHSGRGTTNTVLRALLLSGRRVWPLLDRVSSAPDAIKALILELCAEAACRTMDRDLARKAAFLIAYLDPDGRHDRALTSRLAAVSTRIAEPVSPYFKEVRADYHMMFGTWTTPLPSASAATSPPPPEHGDPIAPQLSIVIPTGNRLEDVNAHLDSYLDLAGAQTEVLFSVYADRQNTARLIESRIRSRPGCRLIETPAKAFSKAAAVNLAGAQASGRFLLTLDCDMAIHRPHGVAALLERMNADPNAIQAFDYRGVLCLRADLFTAMGGYPEALIERQHREAVAGYTGPREVDDTVLIGEFLAHFDGEHLFWSTNRFERITRSGSQWTVTVSERPDGLPRIARHDGEHRITSRGGRRAAFDQTSAARNYFQTASDCAPFEPTLPTLRRYAVARRIEIAVADAPSEDGPI